MRTFFRRMTILAYPVVAISLTFGRFGGPAGECDASSACQFSPMATCWDGELLINHWFDPGATR